MSMKNTVGELGLKLSTVDHGTSARQWRRALGRRSMKYDDFLGDGSSCAILLLLLLLFYGFLCEGSFASWPSGRHIHLMCASHH